MLVLNLLCAANEAPSLLMTSQLVGCSPCIPWCTDELSGDFCFIRELNWKPFSSGQDGGIGRYTLPPHTTKTRTTTNLKTKNNQNCQKIELYGNPTTKELKKKHSRRLVGGAERGSWTERTHSKTASRRLGQAKRWWLVDWVVPHLCADKLGETTGEQNRLHNPGFQYGEMKPQNFWLKKPVGVEVARDSQPHRRGHWRDPQGPRTYTHPPTWESAQEGAKLLVGSRGSDWKPTKSQANGAVPSQTPLPHTAPQHSKLGCPALLNT